MHADDLAVIADTEDELIKITFDSSGALCAATLLRNIVANY